MKPTTIKLRTFKELKKEFEKVAKKDNRTMTSAIKYAVKKVYKQEL